MKVERVRILDLILVLVSYLKGGIEFVDIKLDKESNTLKVKPTESNKSLPAPKEIKNEDEDNIDGLKKAL